MKTLPFRLVDAFADQPLSGNPCAVVLHADELSDLTMQQIAKEMNQSETAFLMQSKVADLKARYFTPAKEIPLAGHPTIASIHAALELGIISMKGNTRQSFSLELRDGPITVEIIREINQSLIVMNQRKPIFLSVHESKNILPLFSLDESDLIPNAKIQTVSTGTPMLMIPVKSHDALKKIRVHGENYLRYRDQSDFFSAHIFCTQGISTNAKTFARHPQVLGDSGEDAFTGSATGCMAAYLWKYSLIETPEFVAEQGHWMNRPGKAQVKVTGPRENIEGVSVAGTAFTVVSGELRL